MSDISSSSLPSYPAPPDRAGGPLDEVEPVDAGSGTGICSVCYEKLVREQVDIR